MFKFALSKENLDISTRNLARNSARDISCNSARDISHRATRGILLVETLIWIGIFGILILGVSNLFVDTLQTSRYVYGALDAQSNLHKVIQPFAKEIREARQAENDDFMIDTASANELVFYSDSNDDFIPEKISYKKEGEVFTKEIGGEMVYRIENLVSDYDLLRYFDKNSENLDVSGDSDTSSDSDALENLTDIRKIEITLIAKPLESSTLEESFVARTVGTLRNVYGF